MSGPSSDSANEPYEPIEGAIAGDLAGVRAPLDFSGSMLGFPENPSRPAPGTEESVSSPVSALEAAAFSDALSAKILPMSFGDRVFLLPSEAEAWRFAIDMARRYHGIVGRPKRRRLIICLEAADEAGGRPPGLEGDDEIVVLRTDDHAALLAEINVKTAGILIAPVRTRAGLEVVSGGLLARLREIADEYGLILAFDETLCGFGRSGMLWAHEWTGVTPDLMIAALGLGDHGLGAVAPVAAVVVTQRVARGAPARPPLVNRAALLAGHAVMDALLTPGFLEQVQNRSWRLEDRLAELLYKRRGTFTALSGLGLMQGLVCSKEAEPLRATLAERGLFTRATGSILGLFPPLTVEESEIDAAVATIDAICAREEY